MDSKIFEKNIYEILKTRFGENIHIKILGKMDSKIFEKKYI
jgi:hypothetical protein